MVMAAAAAANSADQDEPCCQSAHHNYNNLYTCNSMEVLEDDDDDDDESSTSTVIRTVEATTVTFDMSSLRRDLPPPSCPTRKRLRGLSKFYSGKSRTFELIHGSEDIIKTVGDLEEPEKPAMNNKKKRKMGRISLHDEGKDEEEEDHKHAVGGDHHIHDHHRKSVALIHLHFSSHQLVSC